MSGSQSNRSDFWGGVKVEKVAAPEFGEGQGKLVATRELECFCCGKKVMLQTENPLSPRPKDPEIVPKFAPGADPRVDKPIGVEEHRLMTAPMINPLNWRFEVPPGWTAVTTLPRSNWPGNFIAKVESGIPPRIAVETCMKENEAYERWYCSALCRMLEELEGHAMREGWTSWQLWWRKSVIKLIFWGTDMWPGRQGKDRVDGEEKITQNLKARAQEN